MKEVVEKKILAIKKWKDGSETTMEYFDTVAEANEWIRRQKPPRTNKFSWCIGEY